jgi:hypothetical protein
MAPIPDEGPKYPWGNDPWPGTENIKADAAKNHPAAKDGYWFDQGDFNAVLARLKSRRAEIDPSKVKKHLDDAGHFQQKDFGQWAAAVSLHTSAKTAHDLMQGAYDNFIKAFDAVISRLESTAKTNTGVEVDNVGMVTFNNILTVDPNNPAPPAPPGQTQPGQTTQPGSYS